uniref:Taperin n=1 Tax=Labrus bergylta TaxID=56723 RepID=A0A3Q3G120_9LABR
MPAWKREILERRKAKGGGSGGAGSAETSPGGAGPQRVNGDCAGNVNGSSGSVPKSDSGASGGSGRNYTITTASQHYSNNKEPPRPAAPERTFSREDERQESLVLQESLGPLEENPFIKLEKERRRRQDRDSAARPVQHILELYGSVPGIRTIRAENIIIIESDPDYFPEAGGKSEENLSTLGRVSRMLQKFDSNYGKLQKKSHSTENLLDLDCGSSSRPRLWSKQQPDLVPKPRQRFEESGGRGTAVTSRDEPDRGQTKPTRERDCEGADVPPKPKVPCSPETLLARAVSPSSPLSKASRSPPDFEIRPSSKPDLSKIPDGDLQARALANLRLQSRNSFQVVPKRRPTTEPLSPPPVLSPVPSSPPAPSSPPLSPSFSPAPSDSPAPSPVPAAPSLVVPEQLPVDQLPVTNIDDIDVEPPQRVPVPSPLVHRKKGNTFTVVPKRRPEPEAQPSSPEPQQEASTEGPPGSTPPQAPYSQLGSLLKKRYPAVEDIEVVGGYLSLEKSCLSKTGSTGKKVRFTTFILRLYSSDSGLRRAEVVEQLSPREMNQTGGKQSPPGRETVRVQYLYLYFIFIFIFN